MTEMPKDEFALLIKSLETANAIGKAIGIYPTALEIYWEYKNDKIRDCEGV